MLQTWQIAALSNFSLEILLPTLHILDKTQTVAFPISGFLASSLQKISHNSRTSNDINIKLGSVTKLGKRNTASSKKLDVDVVPTKNDLIVIFRFMTYLEQA